MHRLKVNSAKNAQCAYTAAIHFSLTPNLATKNEKYIYNCYDTTFFVGQIQRYIILSIKGEFVKAVYKLQEMFERQIWESNAQRLSI